MAYGCYYTSVAAIGNGFVEVSQTSKNVTLFGFDDDLSNKSISIGAVTTLIDLPNVTIIYHLN